MFVRTLLCILPVGLLQETILFDGADVAMSNRFGLGKHACLLTMEIVCLG
ncbi:hypothetical protein [Iodobacter sp.]|nr:hypothetical protein [Iodobacter sp.]